MKLKYLIFFLLSLWGRECISQIQFLPWQSFNTANDADLVAIGDLNNDGLNDVAVVTSSSPSSSVGNSFIVFYQTLAGGLSPVTKFSYPASLLNPAAMRIADVNNDQLQDVIISNADSISIIYQNNSGGLNNKVSYFSGSNVNGIACGDLNNDGLTDIAVCFRDEFYIRVFYQSSSGLVSRTYPTLMSRENAMEIGDINSDGLNDLVFMPGQYYGGIRIYLQDTLGILGNPIMINSPGPFPNEWMDDISIGNLNNDGKNDIVIAGGGNSPRAAIIIWYQDPDSLLSAPLRYPAYEIPNTVEIADFDDDGKNEIVNSHDGWSKLTIHTQDSIGLYSSYLNFDFPYINSHVPNALCVGDVNNDSKTEIVFAGGSYGLIVMYNTSNLGNSIDKFGDLVNEIFLYPNPAIDKVIIDLRKVYKKVSLSLFDITGSLVLKSEYTQNSLFDLNTEGFQKGVYFVKVESASFIDVKKLIIR